MVDGTHDSDERTGEYEDKEDVWPGEHSGGVKAELSGEGEHAYVGTQV